MTSDDVITMLNSEDCKLATDTCLMRYKVRDCWKCILEEYSKTVYNKAIDDFSERLIRYVDCGHLCSPTEMRWSDLSIVEMVKKLAEQLKAGGTE